MNSLAIVLGTLSTVAALSVTATLSPTVTPSATPTGTPTGTPAAIPVLVDFSGNVNVIYATR